MTRTWSIAVAFAFATLRAGTAGAQVAPFDHVAIIVLENHEYSDIVDNPDAPYLNALIGQSGLGTNYTGISHPSLPNYMAITSGETVFDDDCVYCRTDAPSVVDEVEAAGLTWRAYMEDMPSPCGVDDVDAYAVKHNPFVHHTAIADDPVRCANVVPFSQFWDDVSRIVPWSLL